MSELSCANNCLNRDEYLKSQNVAVLFAQHKAKALEDKAKALEADVTILLKASAEGQQQLNELSKEMMPWITCDAHKNIPESS